tara:strand:+ start:33 stop:1130 length:1098 start_codon:yes stop_codon:yes gene_type:complete
MTKKFFYLFLVLFLIIFLSFHNLNQTERNLSSFKKGNKQVPYNRNTENYTPIVDSHVHFMPFGGDAVPFNEVINYFKKSKVYFVNVYGIGQRVPIDSDCTYYLDCPGVPVLPTIKNDMINAENFIKSKQNDIHLTLSMTFPDLANPEKILQKMKLLDEEYPNVFNWMGEVNLIKQALLNNFHEPAVIEDISKWKDFMEELKKRNIPINIHSDLGNNNSNTKFLYLMEEVLKKYPENKIVWAHMGLSKELSNMKPENHIKIMKRLLDNHPKLMLDITWRVLEDNYFKNHRKIYTRFFNDYSERILPGTDFVASSNKNFESYKTDLEVTSQIHKYLSDEAFRNIVLGNNYFKLLGLDYEAPEIFISN